jgi:predicted 3-demethylubiquinone-9 3-methyltransferase (glyoxalase superfamily)
MSKLIFGVAGGMLMACLMSDSQAAEAENAFVKVVGESRVYRLEQKGEKDFNAYCGGVAPATFSVAAQQPDWVLVRPASGSLAITPGTSGVWKVKSQLGEDKPDGRIYL